MSGPLALLTPQQLAELVRAAVREELADLQPSEPDGLDDRQSLARRLRCSDRHVDTLRSRGLPTIWLGDAPRFRWAEVLEWLESREVAEK